MSYLAKCRLMDCRYETTSDTQFISHMRDVHQHTLRPLKVRKHSTKPPRITNSKKEFAPAQGEVGSDIEWVEVYRLPECVEPPQPGEPVHYSIKRTGQVWSRSANRGCVFVIPYEPSDGETYVEVRLSRTGLPNLLSDQSFLPPCKEGDPNDTAA